MKITRILALVLILAGTADATEIRTGILAHDVADLWGRTKIEHGVDINAELVLGPPNWIRPHIGITINSCGDTSKIYAGATLEHLTRSGIFANLALGAAIHNGDLSGGPGRALGSRALFRIAIEAGYRFGRYRISAILDHISNANLADHNAGMDSLGIRCGWGPA